MASGIFGTLMVLYLLRTIQFNINLKLIIISLLIFSLVFTFTKSFDTYQRFYEQSDGTISVLVREDQNIIDYFNNPETKNCLVVSDPYTQLNIAGFTEFKTANAHYMKIESRERLFDFVQVPNERTYGDLLEIEELKDFEENEICFVYTSRLAEAKDTDQDFWVQNIYTYILDNDYPLGSTRDLEDFLGSKGFRRAYKDNHFVVFTKRT